MVTYHTGKESEADSRGRVLLVDDEPEVVASLQRQLRGHFEVLTADSGASALRLLRREAVDVIVSDQRMPGMTGAELLAAARELNPEVTRIILTGYTDLDDLVDAVNRAHIHGYITKPWDAIEIRTTLGDAVNAARLRRENQRLVTRLKEVNDHLGCMLQQRSRRDGGSDDGTRPSGRVLVVDDEAQVRETLRRQLQRQYEVLTADSAGAAMAILKRQQVDVIVSDQRMPDMNGGELLARVRELDPEVTRIILTGYSDLPSLADAVNRAQIHGYITKPWELVEIRSTIDDAVGSARLRRENRRLVAELKEVNEYLEQRVQQRTQALQESTEATERASQALRGSESRFRSLFEQAGDGVAVHDRQGRILDVNQMLCKLFGYTKEEFCERWIWQTQAEESNAHAREAFERLLMDGKARFESDFVGKSGQHFYGEVSSVLAADGQNIAYAIFRDISRRRRIEQEQLRSHRWQESLIRMASAFINLPVQRLDSAIQRALQDVAELIHADRGYLFDYDFDAGTTSNTFEWCAGGISPQIDGQQAIALEDVRSWVNAHCNGDPVYIADVQAMPEGPRRAILEPREIQSLISLPLLAGEVCLGFVGFDWVRRRHELADNELRFLRLFAHMLVNVAERRQLGAALESQLDELRRWHDATLGREGRAAELKREVNALLIELGRTPIYSSVLEAPGEPQDT